MENRIYFCGMTNEKAVAEKLLQVQAIQLSPNQPFTWASGWKSPIYCDNRKVLSFPLNQSAFHGRLIRLNQVFL
jgi:orotate phosphoribosyltransferase